MPLNRGAQIQEFEDMIPAELYLGFLNQFDEPSAAGQRTSESLIFVVQMLGLIRLHKPSAERATMIDGLVELYVSLLATVTQ